MNKERTMGIHMAPYEDWRVPITGRMLIEAVKNIQPTDHILSIEHVKRDPNERNIGFGMDYDENKDYYVPTLFYTRWTEETDEEYTKRIQEKERMIKQQEEKDKLEYLRLKAKYE